MLRLEITALLLMLGASQIALADGALLVEQPYGEFGQITPTGHAAIYLSGVCAESPTRLRRCEPGEGGVVLTRNAGVSYDWVAMPAAAYLYAVEDGGRPPAETDRATVNGLRAAYRRSHPTEAGLSDRNWQELLGVAYERRAYAFQFATRPEQDEALIARLNSSENKAHFSLFFHNCADFARWVVDFYYRGAVRRSLTADSGITTPKQLARSLVRYGNKHPEAQVREILIPQIPGAFPRSRPIHGVFESILKSKKYLVPLAIFHPAITASLAASYLSGGRFNIEKRALVATGPAEIPVLAELGASDREQHASPGNQ